MTSSPVHLMRTIKKQYDWPEERELRLADVFVLFACLQLLKTENGDNMQLI
jgi:hypothetical protein